MTSATTTTAGPFPQSPHGRRARYVAGCRCDECRRANREYAAHRAREAARGRGNGLVSTDRARRHLHRLSAAGVGSVTVSDLTGISRTILQGIRAGRRRQCRAATERRILDVPVQAWSDGQLVDAGPTWARLDALLAQGWTKTEIARRLGSQARVPALQLSRHFVTAANAAKVRRLFETSQAAHQAHQEELQDE